MSRLWKILVLISLVLNGVCLLYVYVLIHPNPYGQQYYETEQTKMELRQLKDELSETKVELGELKSALVRPHAGMLPLK